MKALRLLALFMFALAATGAGQAQSAQSLTSGVNPGDPALKAANCGYMSLAYLLQRYGADPSATHHIGTLLPATEKGASIAELESIARLYGYALRTRQIDFSEINSLPLPAIVHLFGHSGAVTGHFATIESASHDQVLIHDPQKKTRTIISAADFEERWSGIVLVIPDGRPLPGRLIRYNSKSIITGGTDEVSYIDRGKGETGEPDDYDECPRGRPRWAVNKVNFNLYMADIPLWYSPAIGPKVDIKISYNSEEEGIEKEIFGKKWQFNYSMYLIVNNYHGFITVVMPDGRRDTYLSAGDGTFTKPYKKYNTLTKISNDHYELTTLQDTVYVFKIPPGTDMARPYLVEKKNAYGLGLKFEYNTAGELITIKDALNQSTTLTYTDGKVAKVIDPFGRFAEFEYKNDELTRITDMGGYWTSIGYTEDTYLSYLENERGRTSFKIETPKGASTEEYPPPDGDMGASYRITITDPLGYKSEYFYNGLKGYGWYVSANDYVEYLDETTNNFNPNVPKTFYHYANTAKGLREEIQSITYPGGRYVAYTYNFSNGLKLSESDAYGNITRYTYNQNGLMTSVQPPSGVGKTYSYDQDNQVDLVNVSTPGLNSIDLEYNDYHMVTRYKDSAGKDVEITYNDTGLVDTIRFNVDDEQVTTQLVYYEIGSPSKYRIKQIVKAGYAIAEYSYDNIGRIISHTDENGVKLLYEYDNLDHVVKVTYPDLKFIEYAYSGCCPHLIDRRTGRDGRTTLYNYDAVDQLIEIINPEKGSTRYVYDGNGNRIQLTDANNNTTEFIYGADNNLSQKVYADGKATSYSYDKNGQVNRRIDARGIRTNYVYNENKKLIRILYSDSTPDVTYSYDQYGRVSSMQDGIGMTAYAYNADSKIQSVNGPWENDTITYSYDTLGRITGVNPETGQPVTYTYDELDRMENVISPEGTFTYAYVNASRLLETLTRPKTGRTKYEYNDPLKRLTAVINENDSSQMINSYHYAYDDPDNPDQRSSETIVNGPALDLTNDETIEYNYNELNQLLQSSSPEQIFEYDADGNMTRGYTPDGYPFAANYDAENRLVSTEFVNESGDVIRTEYGYSGYHLLSIIRNYKNGELVSAKRIIRNGFLALQERDAKNVITNEYLWGLDKGGGIGGLLSVSQSTEYFNYIFDGKGNVTGLLNENQDLVNFYRYDSFGRSLNYGDSINQPYLFSTKRYDFDTGLNYFGYRFYSAAIGRWMNRDPIEESGGINLYGFVQNNPIGNKDLWGLENWQDVFPGIPDYYVDYDDGTVIGAGPINRTIPPPPWLLPSLEVTVRHLGNALIGKCLPLEIYFFDPDGYPNPFKPSPGEVYLDIDF